MIWVIFFCFKEIPCTRRQCIVFFSSLVVLFERNLLERGQLFSRETLWWGGQFSLGPIFLGAIVQGAILGENCSGFNYPGGGAIIQGTIIQEASTRGAIFLGGSCLDTPWKSAKGSFAVKSDTHSSWYETNSYIYQFSKSTIFYFIYKYKFGTNSQSNRSRAVFMKRVRLFSKQKHFLSCY